MTINKKFEISQIIQIVPMKAKGRVIGFRVFNNGEEKAIGFYEDELEATT